MSCILASKPLAFRCQPHFTPPIPLASPWQRSDTSVDDKTELKPDVEITIL